MEEYKSDELTLKELILKIQEYFWVLIKNWWVILLVMILTTGLFLAKHYSQDLTYGARLKYVIEGQSGTGGGIANLLGSLGAGGKSGGKLSPFKVLEIAHGSTLFSKVIAQTTPDGRLLANVILEEYNLIEKWSEKSPQYKDYKFEDIGELDNNDILKQKVIKRLHGFVLGSESNRSGALTGLSLDDETGIYTISSAAITEELSLLLTNGFYKEIRYFFEEEVFRDQRQIAEILDAKADSLQSIRNYKIREMAKFENRNRAIIGRDLIAERTIINMEQQAINRAYGEIVKNREMTDISRRDQKPLFVVIDKPYQPLAPAGSSLFRNVLLGLILGGVFSIFFLIIRKIYRDVMSQ